MDVGVSSMQLDQAERGFSFRLDGPLDMRMGQAGRPPPTSSRARRKAISPTSSISSARSGIRAASPAPSWRSGRRRRSRPRARSPTSSAGWCARKPGDIHPATRTFQALRIFVNEELEELQTALAAAERVLKPGGRLVVVSFHSLEDRIVKNFLSERGKTGGGSRHLPEAGAGAPSFQLLTRAARDRRRGGGRAQSARPFGKAARRRAHRGAGA